MHPIITSDFDIADYKEFLADMLPELCHYQVIHVPAT